MRNLIVCCDGTWNTPEQETAGVPTPTNVVRLKNALAETAPNKTNSRTATDQLVYYHPGVGTDGSVKNSIIGGGAGKGLGTNVMSAYYWLASKYKAGDRIFLFGFSRGAFTARSIGGMICKCGLLNARGTSPKKGWRRVQVAFDECYRVKEKVTRRKWAEGWNFHGGQSGKVPIHFIGVWDTVGALGIPNDLELLNLLDDPKKWNFHDVSLSPDVVNARHAVAIDELRASFAPTLWKAGHPGLKQVWFAGVHSDVGGGYPETGLSDIALKWMIDEAEGCGLGFEAGMVAQLKPDPQGVLHNSLQGFMKALPTCPRSVPKMTKSASIHPAVIQRRDNPPITQAPYWPSHVLGVNKSATVTVYAQEHWNATRLYLLAGKDYSMSATGEWVDKNTSCGPEGTSDGKFQKADLVHIFAGFLSSSKKLVTRSADAQSELDRRCEDIGWFALTCAVANGGNPTIDGSPASPEFVEVGKRTSTPFKPKRSGYLYAFANDAWLFYSNNRGSVQLKVKRLT